MFCAQETFIINIKNIFTVFCYLKHLWKQWYTIQRFVVRLLLFFLLKKEI